MVHQPNCAHEQAITVHRGQRILPRVFQLVREYDLANGCHDFEDEFVITAEDRLQTTTEAFYPERLGLVNFGELYDERELVPRYPIRTGNYIVCLEVRTDLGKSRVAVSKYGCRKPRNHVEVSRHGKGGDHVVRNHLPKDLMLWIGAAASERNYGDGRPGVDRHSNAVTDYRTRSRRPDPIGPNGFGDVFENAIAKKVNLMGERALNLRRSRVS